jgi:hypothetical protein
MTSFFLHFRRALPFFAFLLGFASSASAQFEIRGAGANRLYAPLAIAGGTSTISALSLTNAGAGYAAIPVVTISGGGATTNATATATVAGGVVTGFTITNPGAGYTSPPTITVSGGGATVNATAVAVFRGVPVGTGDPITTAQFSGLAANTGGSAPKNVHPTAPSTTLTVRYPAQIYLISGTSTPSGTAVVYIRSTVGSTFAAGVPRYSFGDVIMPPATQDGGVILANASYWRAEPVKVGEVFSQAAAPTSNTPISLAIASVAVVGGGSGYTSAPTVVFSGGNPTTIATATAVISQGVVTSITLTNAGAGYTALPAITFTGGGGSGAEAVAVAPRQPFYYSPHAGKVFASQSGRVAVTWVTRVPVTTTTDATPRYRYREEVFAVSSATQKPSRTIYWTERSFTGPLVNIPGGKIETVNPVYSANFPATVAAEYQPVGVTPPVEASAQIAAERRTLWFDKTAGIGTLHAYNIEGRLLVEYLGPLTGAAVHEFIAADVVDVVRVADPVQVTVLLGDRLTPRNDAGDLLPIDGNSEWVAAPVASNISAADGQPYYSSITRKDSRKIYHAERENLTAERVAFYWLEQSDASIHFLGDVLKPGLEILWPRVRNHYTQIWPSNVTQFSHYTVPTGGSAAPTGLQFSGGQLPQVVYQDDPSQAEGRIDTASQRFIVSVTGDGLNRSLLKFTAPNEVWYVRLYNQADGRAGFLEGDALAAINTTATVGDRINAPAGHELGGYIASGTNYLPAAYADPFAVGATEAARKAIIPVNAMPGSNVLKVWWFKKIEPPSSTFLPFYVPAKVGVYTVSYPASPATIVLASNSGSGDLNPAEIAGSVYFQNNRTLPGFNPNEEHALMIAGRAYALRDDLNNTSADPNAYTSQPFVLVHFTHATDARPAMRVFKVLREFDPVGTVNDVLFDYPVTAGTILPPPMPLPILPLPVDPVTELVRNVEVAGTPDTAAHGSAPAHYTSFTYKDRKGYDWVYRGPHAGASPTLGMRFYYTMREGFFVPGVATQPAVGTILPYLRPLSNDVPQGDPITGTPLTIIYRPVWPATAPELRVAETLALPKFGLPAILSQTSAEVLYQQSVAANGTTKPSVTLHDPIREKTFALGVANQLGQIPGSIVTAPYQGKVYFQGVPPHLQNRFFFDGNRGTKGALVLLGKFMDEIAGEDYVDLNVLSPEDVAALKAVCLATDTNKSLWNQAIDNLTSKVETFIPDPLRPGTYKVGSFTTVGATALATISDSDTAVVNYALTATGYGSGWVSMIFGNGEAFTPEGEPVSVAVFKVAPRLYTGELKVQPSSNPLDEMVSMRHSGDFAAKPDDYEFEWRYAPPQDGVSPPVYTYAMTQVASSNWRFVANPAGALPSAAEYTAAPAAVGLPFALAIRTDAARALTRPGRVAKRATNLDFSSGVPARVVFSADFSDTNAGFVLYINGTASLAHQAPAPFTNVLAGTGLVAGALSKQFEVDGNYFQAGANTVELALFTSSGTNILGSVNLRFDVSTETDRVAAVGSPWQTPNGVLSNQVVVGGSATAPLGSPLLVLTDNYFTMRYRPKINKGNILATGSNQSVVGWSRWMPAKLVEGWIKRVLAGINPFNQRVGDLYNNAVNTDVSLLTQAGKRWEGNISLNLANIDQFGLVEIYETVLNRGKNISIDSGYDYAPANDALLLAAGYLNDLYTILGNEAYADAANPTISVDDTGSATEVNTSRFSFEGQTKSVLEEELALLRGRDDFLSPGVTVSPAYNRLYWNYTRGINSGEALYAVNYNVREKAGSPTADGKIDAADAQRMFPQGHGDSYGHYLTALKGYTRLLQHSNFTWTPRSEAVTVLGQAIQIDYFDERKFAAAAANVARSAQQILALTHRQAYRDDPALGWGQYQDGATNPNTGVTRHWGVDEWTARATQGTYFNWVLGNAILPAVDNNPQHSGVQVIDRTTVLELKELPTLAEEFQTRIDNVNAHLNPLGLSSNAIAFDISPSELKSGKSHFDQVYERSLRAVLNAKGAFDQAARMTRLLRNQENQLSSATDSIDDQEGGFTDALIELYGKPYPGDIGAGKTYAQGYTGPDLLRWFIIDRSTDIVDTSAAVTVNVRVPVNFKQFPAFTTFAAGEVLATYNRDADTAPKTITVLPNQVAQFADVWARSSGALGTRGVTGAIQQALSDFQSEFIAFRAAGDAVRAQQESFARAHALYTEMVSARTDMLAKQNAADAEILRLAKVKQSLTAKGNAMIAAGTAVANIANTSAEFLPKVIGLATDGLSGVRGGILLAAAIGAEITSAAGTASLNEADYQDVSILDQEQKLAKDLEGIGFSYEQKQFALEYEMQYRELVASHYELAALAATVQRASENARNLVAAGEKIQADRETFRQRAAAVVQGYRTKDITFRTFRNEALEQYRSLYDLAARYTYLAAKSYDYETGLLGSTSGQSVINAIVASRALGDLTGGVPQATVSTLGDAGLAGTMARLQADWSVAKPRLGINNPDTNGTLFSLRRELFRLLPDSTGDTAWQQTLEQHIMSNIMADSDVAANARNLKKPDGSAVPGIVIPFSTTIQHGMNFFGLPYAAGDHNYTPSNYATKIYSVGTVLNGYVGMDPYSQGAPNAGGPASTATNALGATPYVYLIPVGSDYMLAPPLGDTGTVRTFDVKDQALPLPFNLGATSFSTTQFFNANGTLSEAPWILRKHQAFRPVSDPAFFYSTVPAEFTSSRLVGRSVWNGGWKLVIPAYTLLNNETEALNRFVASVKDIQLFLRTYSHSGN